MSSYQNRPWESDLYLSLSGTPSTTIAYNTVTVQYKKFSQTAFTTRVLLPAEWINLGGGFYTMTWPLSYMDTLGPLMFTLSSANFDNFTFGTIEVDPQPVSFLTPPNICVLTGNVVDIGGNPAVHRTVSARLPEFPAIVGSSVIDADKVFTSPDYLGNFTLALIQGQTVLLEIERTGIYSRINIPFASTANLADIVCISPPPPCP